MKDIKISISDYLLSFLDRYYPSTKTLEERFYIALNEGYIIHRGKSFYLSIKADRELKRIIEEDRIAANENFGNDDNTLNYE